MRVAISDYDGTLSIGRTVKPSVISAIKQWRAQGNRFGIATGRDLSMLMHEILRWQIPFDCLLCCNGAAIYDHDLALLKYTNLDPALVPQVLQHPASLGSVHYELCRNGKIFLFLRNREESWFPRLGTPYTELSQYEALSLAPLQQIGLAYQKPDQAGQASEELNQAFGSGLHAHHNWGCIDVTPKGINKASGIKQILGLKQWPDQDLLVVGDGGNDLAMIKQYNGYAVTGAAPEVQLAARRMYADVGEMLNDFM